MTTRTGLLLIAVGMIGALPVAAAPSGILNVDSCSGGVTVTATAINFNNPCLQAGAGTTFTSLQGQILIGETGTINNLGNPFPPGATFFSFKADTVEFDVTLLGPGSANTTCTADNTACSIVAGSPFILIGDALSTTVFLPVQGTVTDANGTSDFFGRFSANFTVSPSVLQAAFFSNGGQLSSTTFAGSFTATPQAEIPEASSMTMATMGLALLGISRFVRKYSAK